jgi:threonine synthase
MATDAAAASGGKFIQVTDAEITEAQAALASEGIFVEPASAAAVAGAWRLGATEHGVTERGATGGGATDGGDGDLVCVLTGHGLKDPDAVPRADPILIPAALDALRAAIEQDEGA